MLCYAMLLQALRFLSASLFTYLTRSNPNAPRCVATMRHAGMSLQVPRRAHQRRQAAASVPSEKLPNLSTTITMVLLACLHCSLLAPESTLLIRQVPVRPRDRGSGGRCARAARPPRARQERKRAADSGGGCAGGPCRDRDSSTRNQGREHSGSGSVESLAATLLFCASLLAVSKFAVLARFQRRARPCWLTRRRGDSSFVFLVVDHSMAVLRRAHHTSTRMSPRVHSVPQSDASTSTSQCRQTHGA
jgi:hypothetical protein